MTTCEIILTTYQIFMTTCQIFLITCQVCRLVREKLVLLVNYHWTQVWHRNIWCTYSVFTFIDGIYISPLQYIPTLHASSTNFGLRHSPLLFVVNYWWRDHSTNQNAVICVHSTCSTCTCTYNIDMYFKTFCSTELLHSLSSTFKKIEPCEGNFMHLVRHR